MTTKSLTAEPRGPGSEPKLSVREGEPATLTWGRWTFTVDVRTVLYAGSLHHVVHVDAFGGGDDGDGLSGSFQSCPSSLDGAAEDAATSIRLTVRSLHCEDDDDDDNDLRLYERTIDLRPAIDAACRAYREAMNADGWNDEAKS
jgi:hypothetical protein